MLEPVLNFDIVKHLYYDFNYQKIGGINCCNRRTVNVILSQDF